MLPLAALWIDVRALVLDTARVWWRLLPQLLGVYLLGWLGSQLALRLAVAAGDVSAWLALAVFAAGFLSRLTAIVVILRLCGRELGISTLIPEEERDADERDSSLSHLLAVTLLPFLGIYAAFGEVQKAADQLSTEQLVRYGVLDSQDTILGVLDRAATDHRLRLLLILVVVYLLRRLVDHLHERTGRRVLGFAVALLESFFLLVVIMGGIRVWQLARLWLRDRAVAAWLDTVRGQLSALLSLVHLDLPRGLTAVVHFVAVQVWPTFWEVLTQPLIWLAVAALVYGSHVLSLAELWRKGQPFGARLPLVATFAKRADRVAARRSGPPPVGVQRVVSEVREAFLGDIDDKYLPTFHSLRLVLRAGVVFLGAFVLVYAVPAIVRDDLERAVDHVVGGHALDFWIVTGPVLQLLPDLIVEPVRICLLAVAFRRCLELFRARSALAAVPDPATPVPRTEAA